MTRARPAAPDWLRKLAPEIRAALRTFDGFDVIYGLFVWFSAYTAFVMWAGLIVRAIRGEDAKAGWRETTAAAAAVAGFSMATAAHFRATAASTESVGNSSKTLEQMTEDFVARDTAAIARDERMYRVTRKMLAIAGLTLAAAVVTLVVAIIGH